MELSDIINIVITTATRTPDQAGFGIPLILSHSASWTERTRTYTKLVGGVDADFGSTTPEYKAAAKMFAQNPRPSKIMIGRANTNKPTQQFEITPTVINSYTYAGKLNGLAFSYTSDGSATAAEITSGLKTAIDALGLAVTTSQQNANATLRILANASASWFDLSVSDPNMATLQNHADPGLVTDLDAIRTANKTWYALITLFNSKAIIDAVGAWAETNKILYLAQTQDLAVRDTAKSGTDDVGESTQNSALTHTSVWFSSSTGDFIDAALLGAVLPYDPGTETWAFKALATVAAGSYTGTMRSNMEAKNVGYYEPTAGLNITWEGKVANGDFIDTWRFVDWLQARIGEAIFGKLATAKKIPYTAKGIAVVESALKSVLKQAANAPLEAISPDYSVLVPRIADVPSADKATRTLNNVSFACTTTGAIHKVKSIQGTVSV